MINKLLVLNMKMYMNIDDVNEYLNEIKITDKNVIFCPESIYLPYFVETQRADGGRYAGQRLRFRSGHGARQGGKAPGQE